MLLLKRRIELRMIKFTLKQMGILEAILKFTISVLWGFIFHGIIKCILLNKKEGLIPPPQVICERGITLLLLLINYFFFFFFLGIKIVSWRENFFICLHLDRISVRRFKLVALSASKMNTASVIQVSQNLAPGK